MDARSLINRVVMTFIITAISSVGAITVFNPNMDKVVVLTAIGAGLAAAIALVKNAVYQPSSTNVWINTLERAAWSFIQGAAAMVPATLDLANLSGLKAIGAAALVGGVNATISFAKNLTAAASPKPAAKALNHELGPQPVV